MSMLPDLPVHEAGRLMICDLLRGLYSRALPDPFA